MSGQWERTWLAVLFLHASPWASAITLTLMLLRDLCLPGLLPPLLWVASFLLFCILHFQILAKKKRHSAAEEAFPQVLLKAGPQSSSH